MKGIIKIKSRKEEIAELKSLHQKEVSELKFKLKEATKKFNAEKRTHEETLSTTHNFFKQAYRILNKEKTIENLEQFSFWRKSIKDKRFKNAVLNMRLLISRKIDNK